MAPCAGQVAHWRAGTTFAAKHSKVAGWPQRRREEGISEAGGTARSAPSGPDRYLSAGRGTGSRRRDPDAALRHLLQQAQSDQEEISIARARQAFQDLEFHPSILRGASAVDTTCEIFGGPSALPFGVAPTGCCCTCDSTLDGERSQEGWEQFVGIFDGG
jgi:FMN-dependent dehydrogenase